MFHKDYKGFLISALRRQRGSMLVIAIFILVVMLLIGSAMVNIVTTSGQSVAYEVVGTRAYAAANSGIQQKLTAIFPLDNGVNNGQALRCNGTETSPGTDTTSTDNYNYGNVPGLRQCRSTVTCREFQHDDITYYQLTSVAKCDIGDDEVSRTIVVEARSL